jgi:hypothetical protein
MTDIATVDMFVVATATLRLLYAVVVLDYKQRRVIHFDVTENATQAWLARQITEAFPWDTAPSYLLRDRDTSYGVGFRDRVRAMGIEEVVTAPRSPCQNPDVERIIGRTAALLPSRGCLNWRVSSAEKLYGSAAMLRPLDLLMTMTIGELASRPT